MKIRDLITITVRNGTTEDVGKMVRDIFEHTGGDSAKHVFMIDEERVDWDTVITGDEKEVSRIPLTKAEGSV